jgi:hypothetical protein
VFRSRDRRAELKSDLGISIRLLGSSELSSQRCGLDSGSEALLIASLSVLAVIRLKDSPSSALKTLKYIVA